MRRIILNFCCIIIFFIRNRNKRTFEMEKLEEKVFESGMEIGRLKKKITLKEEEIRKIEKYKK